MKKIVLLIALLIPVLAYAQDTTPPDGVIIINNNATTTYSRTVEVFILAHDVNGVVDMCVSIGTNCTQWEPYRMTKVVTLGITPAWYSICAKVRDVVGWESVMKCVAIEYRTN